MGGAVLFVMLLATIVNYLIYYYILVPLNLGYLQTIAYILDGIHAIPFLLCRHEPCVCTAPADIVKFKNGDWRWCDGV